MNYLTRFFLSVSLTLFFFLPLFNSQISALEWLTNEEIETVLQEYKEPGFSFIEKIDAGMWQIQYTRPDWELGWEVTVTTTTLDPGNSLVVIGTTLLSTDKLTGPFLLQLLNENSYDSNPGNFSLYASEGEYFVQFTIKIPQSLINEEVLIEGIGFVAGYANSRMANLQDMLDSTLPPAPARQQEIETGEPEQQSENTPAESTTEAESPGPVETLSETESQSEELSPSPPSAGPKAGSLPDSAPDAEEPALASNSQLPAGGDESTTSTDNADYGEKAEKSTPASDNPLPTPPAGKKIYWEDDPEREVVTSEATQAGEKTGKKPATPETDAASDTSREPARQEPPAATPAENDISSDVNEEPPEKNIYTRQEEDMTGVEKPEAGDTIYHAEVQDLEPQERRSRFAPKVYTRPDMSEKKTGGEPGEFPDAIQHSPDAGNEQQPSGRKDAGPVELRADSFLNDDGTVSISYTDFKQGCEAAVFMDDTMIADVVITGTGLLASKAKVKKLHVPEPATYRIGNRILIK